MALDEKAIRSEYERRVPGLSTILRISAQFRRQLFQLSALFEMADREFSRLREQKAAYQRDEERQFALANSEGRWTQFGALRHVLDVTQMAIGAAEVRPCQIGGEKVQPCAKRRVLA